MDIIVNQKELTELLYCFHVLTGSKTIIYDENFNKLCGYPDGECEFCSHMISMPIGKLQCDRSNIASFVHCRQDGKPYIYRCHAGLVEATVPIKIGNVIIGYLMLGQIINHKDKERFFEELHKNCDWYGLDFNTLEEAFPKLKYFSDDQIFAISKILEACAGYIWHSDLLTLENRQMISKLTRFLDRNYMNACTSQDICRELSVSRSYLYKISMKYLGMSITEYIQSKRISAACKQLVHTDRLISEIAQSVGIDDYNYFTKVFKKHTGFTPTEYRKQNRG